MRLLVTGGAGFIGSNFTRHWVRAHPDDQGRISMPELAKAMDKDLDTLTKGGQHLSPHVNFLSDVFVASH